MRLCRVPALAAAEGQTFPEAAEWRCVQVHGGFRTGSTDIAGGLLLLLALQIVHVTLRENHTSSAPIANKGQFNLALLNQLVLGSSAGAKQFLECNHPQIRCHLLSSFGISGLL